jgi:hypothetical protein
VSGLASLRVYIGPLPCAFSMSSAVSLGHDRQSSAAPVVLRLPYTLPPPAQVGDPVLHIELRAWADVLVIAPCSANTLAKCAGGLCDNLLTCVVRAWDWSRPLLVRGLEGGRGAGG